MKYYVERKTFLHSPLKKLFMPICILNPIKFILTDSQKLSLMIKKLFHWSIRQKYRSFFPIHLDDRCEKISKDGKNAKENK